MSRRRQSDEIVFGSDSFLDILANIVGILIILIVIAGVRVSQAPVPHDEDVSVDSDMHALIPETASGLTAATEESRPVAALPDWKFPQRAAADSEPIDRAPQVEPPPLDSHLVGQVSEREAQLKQIELQREQLTASAARLAAEEREKQLKLEEARKSAEKLRESLERGRLALTAQDQRVRVKLRDLATLQVALAEAEAQQPPTTVLKHKLTPVGRKVDGKEVHFMLSRNRVAVVPLEELGEELKRHMQRRRDDILRTQRYVGSVGPVQGFRMDYVVERQPTSLIEELRMGQSIIRAGLSEFQIHPQADVITEAVEQALHPHGRFLAALRRAGPDATLTFWVYPDSFPLYRELLEFSHEQGFEVAARPLPEGVPITGSPHGSRSVAQ